jgi:hypothetical protein
MNGVSLSRNALAVAPVAEPPATSFDAPPAASEWQGDGSSPGGLLENLAIQPPALPGIATTQALPFETRTRPASEDRLAKLTALLESLKTCKCDLEMQMKAANENRMELQQAASRIRAELESGNPIPQSLLPILGSFGLLGMMAGLPLAPILSLFGISVGISAAYKERGLQIAAALDRQAAEQQFAAEGAKAELDDVNRKIDSVERRIENEKARLEEAARPAHERIAGQAMVQEGGWVGIVSDRAAITSSPSGAADPYAMFSDAALLRD